MSGGFADTQTPQETSLLIIPFHSNYYISEIDALLAREADLDAIMVRRKLRQYLTQALDKQFADSMDTRNLLLGETSTLDYIYNGVSFNYEQYQDPKQEEKSWLKRKLEKKEDKIYGTTSSRNQGQLKEEHISYDRFMSVDIGNEGMAEYLRDEFGHSHMLFINELDLRRDIEKASGAYGDYDYLVTVHYSVFESDGSPLCGGKVTERLSKSETDMRQLTHSTFDNIASQIISEAYVYLGTVESIVDEAVEE